MPGLTAPVLEEDKLKVSLMIPPSSVIVPEPTFLSAVNKG